MEFLLFLLSFAAALYLSNRSGKAADYMINKLAHRDVGENPTYLFGQLCGLFFGTYGYFLCAVYAGSYGYLWGVLAATIAFPVLAFTIVGLVRLKEAIEDRRRGRRLCCDRDVCHYK